MNTKLISDAEVSTLLDMQSCIPAMRDCLKNLSDGRARMAQRVGMPFESRNIFAMMGGSLGGTCGAKVIVFPGPEAAKARTAQGIIPLFDENTGSLKAVVSANRITHVRTAAASAAATNALARKDAKILAICGAGNLGRAHIEAMLKIRKIEKVCIWNRHPEAAQKLADETKAKYGIDAVVCDTAAEAVKDADIVCTTTSARSPFLGPDAELKPGCHINAVGMGKEIDDSILLKSRIFTDSTPAVMRDSANEKYLFESGRLKQSDLAGEVGLVFAGKLKGRLNDTEITLFETVGLPNEDLAAAELVFEKAEKANLGTNFEF